MRIAYDEAGDPGHPTLVCLPGFASSKDYFLKLTANLRRDYHILVPDLPGFGRSDRPIGTTYSLRQYGRWLEHFLDAILSPKRGEVHFVGNSLGGAIGLELAIQRRYPFRSLSLVATGGVRVDDVPTVYEEIENGRNPFAVRDLEGYEKFRRRVLHRMFSVPAFIRDYLASTFISEERWFDRILNDLKSGGDSTNGVEVALDRSIFNDRLAEIDRPVLVLWGDEDSFLPSPIGRYISERVPRARLEILTGVGHCPQIEAPEEVAALIREFVRETEATPPIGP